MNELKNEASAYLKQHQNNPVHWKTWGPEAFQKALDENKPIFLSIGYSSCHWCHVMAHESFEDQATADYLNENFISIKVDREELPDVDQYYQLACQVMNGRGGWPLSVFLTPDSKPFFIGTYFPLKGNQNMPNFMEVLNQLTNGLKNEKEEIVANADKIMEALKQAPRVSKKVEFSGEFPTAYAVLNALKNYQDNEFGGFGGEPKFPHFSFYEWAIEQMLEGVIPEEQGKHILKSLEMMLMGGIYDQARGGIHRYSVDKKWLVPHFEKMLYDQAGFLKTISKASLIYPTPVFFDGLIQTLDYLNNEMLSDSGYFFAAQDADSEGVEGLYFTFSKEEFMDAVIHFDENLTDHMDDILDWFGITEKGNFEHNLNVISLNYSKRDDFYNPEKWDIIRKVRQAILEERKGRFPPATDNKGIASWNFQMITALIDVVQYSRIEAITKNATTLLNKVIQGVHETFLGEVDQSGEKKTRIMNTTTRSEHVPLLENYVMFAEAELRFYEITANKAFLENGLQTLKYIHKEFFKNDEFFTRSTEFSDGEYFENIHAPVSDQSYKSPVATYIGLIRKWAMFTEIKDIEDSMIKTIDELKHVCLQNPLAFGEMLRSLTYPTEAYRKLDIPFNWLQKPEFQKFFPNFSIRFLLNFTEEKDKWQICTRTECELQGETFEEFLKVFSPEENNETPS